MELKKLEYDLSVCKVTSEKAYLKCMSKFHYYTEVPVHCRMILQCDGFVM